MSEERSLSDFVTGDTDERSGEGVDEATGKETEEKREKGETEGEYDEEGEQPANAEIEPARATYDWTPGGVACAGCGESVERRWQDDGEMVCSDCKEW